MQLAAPELQPYKAYAERSAERIGGREKT